MFARLWTCLVLRFELLDQVSFDSWCLFFFLVNESKVLRVPRVAIDFHCRSKHCLIITAAKEVLFCWQKNSKGYEQISMKMQEFLELFFIKAR